MRFIHRYSTMTSFFILFSFFVATATMILIATTWFEVKKQAGVELGYVNKMVTRSFASELHQHETLLRLLGERLLEVDVLKNPEKARPLIEKLLHSDKSLAGFGLARPDGQLFLVSFISKKMKLPNLLDSNLTKSTFEQALSNKKLTIGHTYFMKQIHKWVIPLRLAIYDTHGKIAFVMTTGIDLNASQASWKFHTADTKIHNHLINDDNYFIYSSRINTLQQTELYQDPLPKPTTSQVDLSTIKSDASQLFSMYDRFGNKQRVYTSFNPEYTFICATTMSYEYLYLEAYDQLFYFVLGILAFYLVALAFYLSAHAKDKKLQAELLWTANHDMLTKLPNRYYLQQHIPQWNQKYKNYVALFMDLDNFKDINDNYGHPFGDKLLIIIAQRLKSTIDSHEHLIRQGGDEFIILSSKPADHLPNLIEDILNTISEVVHIDNISIHPKISIGVAHYPTDATKINLLLSKADMALYKAKEYRCGFYTYSNELEAASARRLKIEFALREAIKKSELYVLMQPQLNAATLEVSGVEALVRWENIDLGFIPPDQFIHIAEEIGEIHNIGSFVLHSACKQVLEVFEQTQTKFTLSINASVKELLQEGYLDNVLATLTSLNFPREYLIIEVTESLLIHDVDTAKQVLQSFKREGIQISLDDFGTGYSSLSMLNGLPVDELKIDQSFIKDILVDAQDLALTKSIIALADLFELKTVAEGVEEAGHVKALQAMGCSILQGYYFAKPLTQEALTDFVTKQKIS